MVNFEEPGNAFFADKYNLKHNLVPTHIVVVDGRPGKGRARKDYQQKVWELVDDQKAFKSFIRGEIQEALK